VHVARLAGVPPTVVKRAAALLEALETRAGRMTEAAALPLFAAAAQNNVEMDTVTSQTLDPLRVAVEAIDPDLLTPREALEALYRLRSLVTVAQGDEAIT
jgi:DNA mismatch repair protein MutS